MLREEYLNQTIIEWAGATHGHPAPGLRIIAVLQKLQPRLPPPRKQISIM